uniref:Uncharacterized protein n=1 Tax=Anguilla anguilla TaxID=7936 RepID=A0A0E9V7J1_ANGAN
MRSVSRVLKFDVGGGSVRDQFIRGYLDKRS